MSKVTLGSFSSPRRRGSAGEYPKLMNLKEASVYVKANLRPRIICETQIH